MVASWRNRSIIETTERQVIQWPASRRAAPQVAVAQLKVPFRYSPGLAPTIVRDGQFRLFFFSREESRIHVHVAHPEGEAKFWLTPSVHLAKNVGLTGVQLRQAQVVVEAHLQEINDVWHRHFGG